MAGASPRPNTLLAVLLSMFAVAGCDDPETRRIHRPNHLSIDARGHLLVGNPHQSVLVELGADGALVQRLGSRGLKDGEIWSVQGVAWLPRGGVAVLDYRLYSLEDQTSYFAEIDLFDASGEPTRSFKVPRKGLTGEGYHEGLAVHADGFVVPDGARDALVLLDLQGRHKRTLQQVLGGPRLRAPLRPEVRDGHIWVAEYKAHRVRKLTLEGVQVLSVGGRGSQPGQFRFPMAIDVHPDGWFVVADLGNYRLQRFAADGSPLSVITPAPVAAGVPVQLVDVAIGPGGRIYAADSRGCRILVYEPGGTLVKTITGWK